MGEGIQTLPHPVRLAAAIAGLAFVTAFSGCAADESTIPNASPSTTAAPTTPTETATPTVTQTPSEKPSPIPVVTTEIVTETETIPFNKERRDDASMDLGDEAVTTKGVDGVKTLTYEVVITDGVESSRQLMSEEMSTKAVDEVTSVGTRKPPPPPPEPPPQPACDPNYAGACVPIDSDVDCAGGSGNGPSYVQGPVRVVGNDIYDLDRDGDGIGCER